MDVIQVSVDTIRKIARPVLGKIFLLLDNSVYTGLVIVLRYKPGGNIPGNYQKDRNQNNSGSAVFHYASNWSCAYRSLCDELALVKQATLATAPAIYISQIAYISFGLSQLAYCCCTSFTRQSRAIQ